jgi:hypothetical protein
VVAEALLTVEGPVDVLGGRHALKSVF